MKTPTFIGNEGRMKAVAYISSLEFYERLQCYADQWWVAVHALRNSVPRRSGVVLLASLGTG